MRRRFGRGRKRTGTAGEKGTPLDAALWMGRISESGLTDGGALAPLALPGVSQEAAVLGETDDGGLLVGYSPRGGGEALFAVLALASSRAEFAGTVIAIAPEWSTAARRRLALVDSQHFAVRLFLAV